MTDKMLYYSLIAAFSGFLFGFDLGILSAANLTLRHIWTSPDFFHGPFILSISLFGTLVGAVGGFIPCDKFGRKNSLFWAGVFFLVSAIGTSLSTDPYFFSVCRFIGGLAIGLFSIAGPTYIAEISPDNLRGRTVGSFQLNIVLGVLLGFISYYFLSTYLESNAWRVMFGVQGILTLVFLILVLEIPESPRWLFLHRYDEEKIREIFEVLYARSKDQIDPILKNLNDERDNLTDTTNKVSGLIGSALIFVILISFFNQASGINFILYNANELIGKNGFGSNNSALVVILFCGINLIFTLWGISIIDKLGRKYLMILGSIGYILGCFLIILKYWFDFSHILGFFGILIFIASHAIGQGIVIWVFISEIFPFHLRAKGYSIGVSIHWGTVAIITYFGPKIILGYNPLIVLSIFLICLFIQLLFVIFIMPETNKKSLEIIASEHPP
jgi:sugar porter (SP) family MFS transporter